jgi:uncharacterized membrane protein
MRPISVSPAGQRLAAVDLLRGIVIVLMLVDHASYAFNAGRYVTDSVVLYESGSRIPAAQFLLRWVTHVCAPAFLFLAGLSAAVSYRRRAAGGTPALAFDRRLLVRGLMLVLLDRLWMGAAFGTGPIFQVLYAIGAGLCCLAMLRRLRPAAVLAAGIGLSLAGELLAGAALFIAGDGTRAGPVGALLATGGRVGDIFVLYPLLPWLAIMLIGWSFGRLLLLRHDRIPARAALWAGLTAFCLFVLVRGVNSYGNMRLYREGAALLQWLHVSKYPPSLSFTALTLGLMFIGFTVLLVSCRRHRFSDLNPLVVFGQTSLFFYLIHVHLLTASARMLGMYRALGIAETLIASLATAALLYPMCLAWRRLKRKYPRGLLRYL